MMEPENKNKKRICFIVNPISGLRKQKGLEGQIAKKFDQGRFDVAINYSTYAGHAVVLAREAIENKTDIVVAVGGDGTINEVASQLIDTQITLGIVPGGSGNGLARHLDIPASINKALAVIISGKTILIDTATLNDVPFISIAGVGFDAFVAEKFARVRVRGFFAYFGIVAKNFLSYKPKQYQIVFANGHEMKTKALFIAFANSNQFGYNTTIAPHALLTDGMLDVCIVKKPGLLHLPLIAKLLLLKKIDQSAFVQVVKSNRITVKGNKSKVVNIDGEPVMPGKDLEILVKPRSLNVIVAQHVEKA